MAGRTVMRIIPLAAVGLSLAIGSTAALAIAQSAGTVHHVGMLGPPAESPLMAAFRQGMQDRGYSEVHNIRYTYRSPGANPDADRAAMAIELVRLKVDVIVPYGALFTRAAMAATATVPIVFVTDEPVEHGFVSSLARPGGNLTGLSMTIPGFTEKQLQVLKEMVPRAKRMAILISPYPRWEAYARESQAAADKLGVRLQVLEARTAEDIDRLFAAATAKNTGVDAIHVHGTTLINLHRDRIVALAKTRRLPAMYLFPSSVTAGGLMSFGPDFFDLYRRLAGHVDRILKGARPADIPVEDPTKYILAINVRTARELGLTVPQSLLLRADRVVD
jgi:putative ABC transport system substrate-binding protein